MARARKQFNNILYENYLLKEEIIQFQNDLDYLKEAIQTVESEYKLKQHIPNERLPSKHKLECIEEIKKQLELIIIREEGGTPNDK